MWPKNGFLALDVFAIDLAKIRSVVGSRDEKLFKAPLRRAGTAPWNDYAWFASGLDPLMTNLEHLVMGKPAPLGDSAKYAGHALRLLTSLQAKRLPVSAWKTLHKNGIPDVDKGLRKLGIDLELGAQLQRGAPVKLPSHRNAPPLGYVEAAEVAATAKLLADAVATASSTSPAAEQCEMRKPAGKKFHSWLAQVVGTDVIQVYRSATGKEDRLVSSFRHVAMTRLNYEGYIKDREDEGYSIVMRTKASPAKAKSKSAPLDGKVVTRLEEASAWYAAGAKKRLGLMFFLY